MNEVSILMDRATLLYRAAQHKTYSELAIVSDSERQLAIQTLTIAAALIYVGQRIDQLNATIEQRSK